MMPDDDGVGYADAAEVYWDKGWCGVLPLKRTTKWPPPKGFTGYEGADPSFADLLQWSELYPLGNLCLRLPDGIIGIDVDAYGAKTGGAALTEAVKRWGPLPEGPQSSSRDDDLVSGIRLFKVPLGTFLEDVVVFPELSIGDIEIIQRHHRYVVCWPSIHPEGRGYWWRNSKGQLQGIPELEDIPELPQRWVEGLKLTPRSLEFTGEAFDVKKALTAGEPSPLVSARLAQAIRELNLPGMSRHDTCMRHVLAILRQGAEGQAGVDQALSLLREVFVAVTSMDASRTRDVAVAEFNRMVTNDNAARELSQPGISDWFRQILKPSVQNMNTDSPAGNDPDAQSANVNRAGNAGAAVPLGDAQPRPPESNSGDELEALEQDFWTARPQHELIFNAALSAMASPWAVLGGCVARVLALVPPSIVLPPVIGGGRGGSLNWFCVISAESGIGKGAATSCADALLRSEINELPVGSGEGMIECYNRAPGKGDDPPPPVVSVMFGIDEIDTLGAMGSRSGQTTMVTLRHGFMGEALGFSTRGRQGERVPKHTYRMTLTASVQPSRAGVLLDDAAGGTPQRFMWFPAGDLRIVEDEIPWPVDERGNKLMLMEISQQDLSRATGAVDVPDEAKREIRRVQAAKHRGEETALDGHALFCREKLAFALAYLDGRTNISLEDWRLSGIASAVSDWTRDAAVEAYQSSREDESRDRGQLRGVEAASADLGKMREQVDRPTRVLNKMLDEIRASMPDGISNRNLQRKFNARDYALVKDSLDFAVTDEQVAQVEGTNVWITR